MASCSIRCSASTSGRLNALDIRVERDYDPQLDLFCFAGEIRQVIANLVGNVDRRLRACRRPAAGARLAFA